MPEEFSFHRGSANLNYCLVSSVEFKGYKIKLTEVFINLPVVTYDEAYENELNCKLLTKAYFEANFIHWNYRYVKLPAGDKKFKFDMPSNSVLTYTFIAEEIKRDGDITNDFTKYDNLKLENRQIIFNNNILYPMQWQGDPIKFYRSFQKFYQSYYGKEPKDSLIFFNEFCKDYHITVIDSSCYDPQVLKSTTTVTIDSYWSKPVPEGSIMYIVTLMEDEYKHYKISLYK